MIDFSQTPVLGNEALHKSTTRKGIWNKTLRQGLLKDADLTP